MCECGALAELTSTPRGLLCDACRGYSSQHQIYLHPPTTLSAEQLIDVMRDDHDAQMRIKKNHREAHIEARSEDEHA